MRCTYGTNNPSPYGGITRIKSSVEVLRLPLSLSAPVRLCFHLCASVRQTVSRPSARLPNCIIFFGPLQPKACSHLFAVFWVYPGPATIPIRMQMVRFAVFWEYFGLSAIPIRTRPCVLWRFGYTGVRVVFPYVRKWFGLRRYGNTCGWVVFPNRRKISRRTSYVRMKAANHGEFADV